MDPIRVRPISSLLLGLFLSAVGNGLQSTLVPLRAGLEGFAQPSIGGIMSAYFVGYLLGAMAVPRLIHRAGHIRAFAALASLASVVTLLHLVVVNPWFWAVFRALNGLCICALSVIIESWLNGHALPQHRGKILSLAGLITVVAIALGQLLLNLAGPDDFVLFCLVSIAISLALVPLSLTRSSAPCVSQSQGLKVRRLLAITPLGAGGMFLTGLSMGAFLGMSPTYVQSLGGGLDTREISLFMAMLMLGAVCLQWPLGWLSDRIDRRRVIACVLCANLSVCLVFVFFARPQALALLPLAFFLGGFGQSLYALFAAWVNDQLPPEQALATARNLLLVFGLGSAIGPFAASLLMGGIGPDGLFWLLSLVYVLMLGATLWDLFAKHAGAREKRENTFVTIYCHSPIGNQSGGKGVEMPDERE